MRVLVLAGLYCLKSFVTYVLWKKLVRPRLSDTPPSWLPKFLKERW